MAAATKTQARRLVILPEASIRGNEAFTLPRLGVRSAFTLVGR